MVSWFAGLPGLVRSTVFVVAMLLLKMLLALVAGALSAFGHPDLLAAVGEAATLRDPLLATAVALLPAAAVADVLVVAGARQP